MKYFTTTKSANRLSKALKARIAYIDKTMKLLKTENPALGDHLLRQNKKQIERMANSTFGKG